jgi:hypothetical protein
VPKSMGQGSCFLHDTYVHGHFFGFSGTLKGARV